LVKSMIQGRYVTDEANRNLRFVEDGRIRFEHEFDRQAFIIRAARLEQSGADAPIGTIRYSRNRDGGLIATFAAALRPALKRVASVAPSGCRPDRSWAESVATSGLPRLPERLVGWPLC